MSGDHLQHLIIGGSKVSLPTELVQNPSLLADAIFSLDAWNNSLSNKERDFLKSYLPNFGQEGDEYRNLWKLFSGDNFHFGNPVEILENDIKSGKYFVEKIPSLERKRNQEMQSYVAFLKAHHKQMLKKALEFRKSVGIDDIPYVNSWREAKGYDKITSDMLINGLGVSEGSSITGVKREREKGEGKQKKEKKKKVVEGEENKESPTQNTSILATTEILPPPGPPPEPFLLFSTLRDCFFLSPTKTATFEELLDAIQKIPAIILNIPPAFNPPDYLRFALNYLDKPPHLPTTNSSTNPAEITVDSPITTQISTTPPTFQWVYLLEENPPTVLPALISLEQLFNFATSRGLVLPDYFLDLRMVLSRQQKCVLTIEPRTPETLQRYRELEIERYQNPSRAFTYVLNGVSAIVAPLVKARTAHTARNHFLLKQQRPSNISLLSLVRDAASKLPGGVGTRADVCLLLRDSQYINESATEKDIQHIVSNVLDRLKSEEDPCVRYDGEQKLWIYLHRQRSERDFVSHLLGSKKAKKPSKKAGKEEEIPPELAS